MWMFDFGTATSPVAPGYTQVTEASRFSPDRGYGWVAGVVESRDRGVGDELFRDFNFSQDATFAVHLPDGTYTVTLTMGDAFVPHDQDIYLQWQRVDRVAVKLGEILRREYTVAVQGGLLSLRLDGRSGGSDDPYAIVNALTIVPVQMDIPVVHLFDFGTVESPVMAGYTKVHEGSDYTPAIGYGWVSSRDHPHDGGGILYRDRGPGVGGSDLLRDNNSCEMMTFRVDVPNGRYTVRLTSGDVLLHDGILVTLNGQEVDNFDTRAYEWKTRQYAVIVTDGAIVLRLDDSHELLGLGDDFYASICALQILGQGADVPAPVLPEPPPPDPDPPVPPEHITSQLVFGPPSTPVPPGYTLIPYTTVYRADRGFGYEGNGRQRDFDRRSGPDAGRYFLVTMDSTFRIDVEPGVYEVTLTMGDNAGTHDQDVYLNWHKVDSIVLAIGEVVTRTYTVAVHDGHLRVQVYGYSGADISAVLHALTFVRLPQALPERPYRQHFDFGQKLVNGYRHQLAPPAEGYQQVTKDSFYAPGGFGWVQGIGLDDRDQSFNTDWYLSNTLTRSLILALDATFQTTLPNGTYDVTLICGDEGSPHRQTHYLQGQNVGTEQVESADYLFVTHRVPVTDGTLTFRMQQASDTLNYAILNGMDIVQVS